MTVSAITHCFNQARFLPQAIDSVLAQEQPVQEYVIVNDGSTDDTADVAHRYAAQHPQIRVLTITNRDMPNALNAGLIALQPVDRVAILDADNWLEPNYTAEMVKHDADAVVSALIRHQGDETLPAALPERLHPSAADLWENCWTHFCPVFKYEALATVGGFHGLMSGDMDWDLWLDFALRGFTVAYCDSTAYHYRDHDGSYTQTIAQQRRYAHRIEMWRHHHLGLLEGFEWIQPEYPSAADIANEQADREEAALAALWSSAPASS